MNTLDNPKVEMAEYTNEPYSPIRPQADNDAIAGARRVILYHHRVGPNSASVAVLGIAPKHLVCAGWAIGTILE